MLMSSPSLATVPMSARAKEYFDTVFMPQYQAVLDQVRQTPLVILVWGPGEGAGDLYRKRVAIRDELRRRGHAAVFSEEISGPAGLSQKMIEFLQAQKADFIVVMQASYGAVAEVHDFAEFRVISAKMLIFVDEKAADGYSYRGALAELKTLYNNVETYKYPDDIAQCNLLTKVMAKVDVMQMVKWRAIESARSWGLIQ